MHYHQTISTSHMYNFDIFSLGPNHSYFAQLVYLIDKTENIPCAILEWSDTILELRNQVGILTLRRAILEWYRFLLCAEHINLVPKWVCLSVRLFVCLTLVYYGMELVVQPCLGRIVLITCKYIMATDPKLPRNVRPCVRPSVTFLVIVSWTWQFQTLQVHMSHNV